MEDTRKEPETYEINSESQSVGSISYRWFMSQTWLTKLVVKVILLIIIALIAYWLGSLVRK